MISESDLYEPMRLWLFTYLSDKYSNYEITTVDSHNERLDRVLSRHGIQNNQAIDIDIQIDILGICRRNSEIKLVFIEAKNDNLTLRDLGQLWAYCKLIDPEEAFLFTSDQLGSLDKLINIYHREDLLDFGDGKKIKKMQIGNWNVEEKLPAFETIRPRL